MLRRTASPVLVLLLAFAVAGIATAAEFTRDFRIDRDELQVVNMIGQVEVVPADGDGFEVTVHVRGEDATADVLEFLELENGASLVVKFPLDEHDDYVYPRLGKGSKSTMTFRDDQDHGNSWLREIFSGMNGRKVTVRGSGRGLEVWADVTIRVPRGAELEVHNGLGGVEAADLEADLVLDTHSGRVKVRKVTGSVLVDTGSGHVEVDGVTGDLDVDTGSGHVELTACEGEDIKVDTGSGHVTLAEVRCGYLNVDTGSGHVKARGVSTDGARIDTGSGSVQLELAHMGKGKFVLDTGSGGIDLVLPPDASARISADTGSGGVSCDVDGADIIHKERTEMELVVGDGEARVHLDAGSGHVKVSSR
ncbi:DUF4097 family beta strand repeat protein [bacterium]|nr:DUF4097 family beta strand repeat protein [bacterium]